MKSLVPALMLIVLPHLCVPLVWWLAMALSR